MQIHFGIHGEVSEATKRRVQSRRDRTSSNHIDEADMGGGMAGADEPEGLSDDARGNQDLPDWCVLLFDLS